MDSNNPIKYSDLVQPDSAITNLIEQLKELSEQYGKSIKEIKDQASQLASSLRGASGATDEGREAIKKASTEADRLAQAEKKLQQARGENAQQIAKLNRLTREQNEINKLIEKRNQSAEGSYNRLSAQYSLNKIRLNAMSEKMRKGTSEGEKLEKETAEIYEQMKKLQEATGKYTLDVGHYEVASKSLKSQLKELVAEIATMTIQYRNMSNEEKASAAGQEMANKIAKLTEDAGVLKDTMDDTNQAIKNSASDTRGFDQLADALQVVTASFAVAKGAATALGVADEDLQKAEAQLMAALAALNGLQTIQTKLQKQSALMQGISNAQVKAGAIATKLETAAKSENIIVSKAATAAQAAFNAVANANPYVLLATAILTVIGAIGAYVLRTKEATDAEKDNQAAMERNRNAIKEKKAVMDSVMEEYAKTISHIKSLVLIAKDENRALHERNAACKELNSIAPSVNASINQTTGAFSMQAGALQTLTAQLETYYRMLAAQKYLESLYEKQIALESQAAVLEEWLKGASYNAEYYTNQNKELVKSMDLLDAVTSAVFDTDYSKQFERNQQNITHYKQSIDSATLAIKNNATAQKEVQIQIEKTNETYQRLSKENKGFVPPSQITPVSIGSAGGGTSTTTTPKDEEAEKRKEEEKAYQGRISLFRKYQDARLEAEKDGFKKRLIQTRYQYDREAEDLQHKLDTDTSLNESEQTKIKDIIAQIYQNRDAALERIENEHYVSQLQTLKETIELRLQAVAKGSAEEIALRTQQLEIEKEIALQQNKMRSESERQSEADITAKYAEDAKKIADEYVAAQMEIFDIQQIIADNEFELMRNSEGRKTRFRLQAERDRIAKILEMNEQAGTKLTDLQKQQLESQMKLIDKQIEESATEERTNDIYGMLGLNLDDKQKQGINQAYEFAVGQLNDFMDARVQAANKAVESSNKEVDAAQSRLDAEMQARANGYAADVELAQKQLADARKNQQKALEDQKKAQRQQQAIQAVQEAGNLVLASTKIWGELGFPWAIPAIAVMWGSFAAAKIKAAQVTRKQEYRDGTIELLQGGSHASGHDIDLGTRADGTQRRAEGGEFFAVINKRNSRRYRNIIPDVINSFNDGTFAAKYMQDGTNAMNINVSNASDLGELTDNVREIRKQGEARQYTDASGNVVIEYKNLKRIIKK